MRRRGQIKIEADINFSRKTTAIASIQYWAKTAAV